MDRTAVWLSARFDAHLERAYQADLLEEKIRLARMVAVLGAFFNAAFFALDFYALPAAIDAALVVRCCMFLAAAGLFYATYQRYFARIYVSAVTAGLGVLGFGIVALIGLAGPNDLARETYYAGLLMVIVAMHMLTFVPLAAALLVTMTLITAYSGAIISHPGFLGPAQDVTLTAHLFFLVSIGLIGVVGQLLRDRYSRDNFILRNSLRRDVAVEEEKNRLTTYLAEHDVLTGLPNRMRFDRHGTEIVDQARRDGSVVVVYFIDLDNFKPVNDQHGHAAGDRVLKTVAERLSAAVGKDGIVARFGGDEFVACMRMARDEVQSVGFNAARFSSAVQRAVEVRDHQLHLTASIGAAAFPLDGDDLQAVVEVADAQMYRAKQVRGEIMLSTGIDTSNKPQNGEANAFGAVFPGEVTAR